MECSYYNNKAFLNSKSFFKLPSNFTFRNFTLGKGQLLIRLIFCGISKSYKKKKLVNYKRAS